MPHTYEELHAMTVVQLRALADGIDHEAVKGHSTMHKEKLLPAICVALGIEAHAHHKVVGIDKAGMKAQIRELKRKKVEFLAREDRKGFKDILHQIHQLKKTIRKSIV
jgi:DNA-binding IclR family transcriptional regulator